MSSSQPAQVGDRVRDTKWGGEYVGTVVREFDEPGEVGVRWDGHFVEDQMSPGEYERISQ